jgi:hypothetical protein
MNAFRVEFPSVFDPEGYSERVSVQQVIHEVTVPEERTEIFFLTKLF